MTATIAEFLDKMGVVARYFDCGRRIQEIPAKTMLQFEDGDIAYPTPYLHHAWLGLLFWDPDAPDMPLLWFLKFPLDEQAKLLPAARNEFLKQLMVTVGHNLQAIQDGEKMQGILEGNPYTFTPTPERQASMHATAKQLMQLEPSDHYPIACDYLKGDLQQWQAVGIQGLADVAQRWQQHQNELINALPNMPQEPLQALCQCLENHKLSGALSKAITERITREREQQSPHGSIIAALVRAISASQATELRQRCLQSLLLDEQTTDIEVLAAIATRCHQDLQDPLLCMPFLERLAQHPQATFNRVLADVLFLPELRNHILACFRAGERSQTLINAIGGLLNPGGSTQSNQH